MVGMTRSFRALVILATVAAGLAAVGPAHAFDPRCPTATPARAKALAERAARYLRAHGAATAFRRFSDRNGGFVAGDLYVFVFDLDGVLRASGGWPETVGTSVVRPASRGGGIFTRMRALALKKGRGWVNYNWYSPCTRAMQPKMSYIIRVGDYIVGVGTYKVPGA
jgi:cytochrome c